MGLLGSGRDMGGVSGSREESARAGGSAMLRLRGSAPMLASGLGASMLETGIGLNMGAEVVAGMDGKEAGLGTAVLGCVGSVVVGTRFSCGKRAIGGSLPCQLPYAGTQTDQRGSTLWILVGKAMIGLSSQVTFRASKA